eukprot:CAMPEP_0170514902 /NCGR_PEP_ID=MMETSP0209-20121228/1417_1 /TAXON_ID=665100 ORGANISM="Litonotus pictus, Strain P1" /NCGR_SAMPLE_ID=MMETSP0209 /ASSEMBLY_ACC=CAM_ASM_000301 /LENGTH=1171 /DNA_ID=CAMNT_0010799167 /DNA_START=240 /DNA_END=3755 /DNA_ORIENTATION=+
MNDLINTSSTDREEELYFDINPLEDKSQIQFRVEVEVVQESNSRSNTHRNSQVDITVIAYKKYEPIYLNENESFTNRYFNKIQIEKFEGKEETSTSQVIFQLYTDVKPKAAKLRFTDYVGNTVKNFNTVEFSYKNGSFRKYDSINLSNDIFDFTDGNIPRTVILASSFFSETNPVIITLDTEVEYNPNIHDSDNSEEDSSDTAESSEKSEESSDSSEVSAEESSSESQTEDIPAFDLGTKVFSFSNISQNSKVLFRSKFSAYRINIFAEKPGLISSLVLKNKKGETVIIPENRESPDYFTENAFVSHVINPSIVNLGESYIQVDLDDDYLNDPEESRIDIFLTDLTENSSFEVLSLVNGVAKRQSLKCDEKIEVIVDLIEFASTRAKKAGVIKYDNPAIKSIRGHLSHSKVVSQIEKSDFERNEEDSAIVGANGELHFSASSEHRYLILSVDFSDDHKDEEFHTLELVFSEAEETHQSIRIIMPDSEVSSLFSLTKETSEVRVFNEGKLLVSYGDLLVYSNNKFMVAYSYGSPAYKDSNGNIVGHFHLTNFSEKKLERVYLNKEIIESGSELFVTAFTEEQGESGLITFMATNNYYSSFTADHDSAVSINLSNGINQYVNVSIPEKGTYAVFFKNLVGNPSVYHYSKKSIVSDYLVEYWGIYLNGFVGLDNNYVLLDLEADQNLLIHVFSQETSLGELIVQKTKSETPEEKSVESYKKLLSSIPFYKQDFLQSVSALPMIDHTIGSRTFVSLSNQMSVVIQLKDVPQNEELYRISFKMFNTKINGFVTFEDQWGTNFTLDSEKMVSVFSNGSTIFITSQDLHKELYIESSLEIKDTSKKMLSFNNKQIEAAETTETKIIQLNQNNNSLTLEAGKLGSFREVTYSLYKPTNIEQSKNQIFLSEDYLDQAYMDVSNQQRVTLPLRAVSSPIYLVLRITYDREEDADLHYSVNFDKPAKTRDPLRIDRSDAWAKISFIETKVQSLVIPANPTPNQTAENRIRLIFNQSSDKFKVNFTMSEFRDLSFELLSINDKEIILPNQSNKELTIDVMCLTCGNNKQHRGNFYIKYHYLESWEWVTPVETEEEKIVKETATPEAHTKTEDIKTDSGKDKKSHSWLMYLIIGIAVILVAGVSIMFTKKLCKGRTPSLEAQKELLVEDNVSNNDVQVLDSINA